MTIQDDLNRHPIREQVLRAIAANREPGYHFCGNFLGIASFGMESGDGLLLETGAHCADADGQAHIGAVAVLADLALALSVRAVVNDSVRLATVSLNLQFTGLARTGRLEAVSGFEGFFQQAAGRQGLARVSLASDAGQVCFGSGAFMVMPTPAGMVLPVAPWGGAQAAGLPSLRESDLREDEAWILRHAGAALETARETRSGFLDHFLGYTPRPVSGGATCTMQNGPHVANRVGHVQGGIQLGLAAVTASAALPAGWTLSGMSACYLKPGEGEALTADSHIIHQGRHTAVVRTRVCGGGRQMLEVTTTHAAQEHP